MLHDTCHHALRPRPMSHRHAVRLLALLAPAALAPAALRAQGDFRGEAIAGVPGKSAYQRDFQSGRFSLAVSSGGAGAAISANGRTGRLGMTAITDLKGEAAGGTLYWTTELSVERTQGVGVLQPFQIYLDGSFGRTQNNPYVGRASASASLLAYVDGDYHPYNGGVSFASNPVTGDGDDPEAKGSHTVWVPIAAGLPGSVATIRLTYKYQVSASDGWDADFSHTARLFVPTVHGLTWTSSDGTLAEQARPAWAAGDRVAGEVPAVPVTTTPEPATVALLGAGVFALAAARRRASAAP